MRNFDLEKHAVFLVSVAAIILAITIFAYAGSSMENFFEQLQNTVTHYVGWFMIFVMNAVLIFMIYLAFSRHRHLRIGGPEATPEFSMSEWIGMLFAAGMGIGLLFYSVAEPVQHYKTILPHFHGNEAASARLAMNMTFLHWGFHPWAVYALVALSLAWFHFSEACSLSFSGPLATTMPKRRAAYTGNIINVFAIIGTVFGVSTSLGLGTSQASAGIAKLTGWPADLQLQLALIVFVSVVACASVLSGVGRGVKLLSQFNLIAAVLLMAFVLFAGETVIVLKALGQHMGYYANRFIETSTWREAYSDTNWQSQWTLFYWAWWISWSPFVGLFIARISRGRTILEFLVGVLLVPAFFNFLWMTVFGSNALHNIIFSDAVLISADVNSSLYVLLDSLPIASFTTGLATLIVLLFFITSADSGALVAATLAAGGDNPPLWQRAFWCFSVLAVTAILLWSGGLQALQTATIVSGVPFALILILLGWALLKGLRRRSDSDG